MIFRHLTGFLRKHGRISKGALERSSSTNLGKITPCNSKRRRSIIFTLDPNKFVEKQQRALDISDLKFFTPFIMLHNSLDPIPAPDLYYDNDIQAGLDLGLPSGLHSLYPPSTAAFLYYFTSPKKPPIGGELRLRVTSSDHPVSFESGFDLLGLNGQPWSRPLYVVSKYIPLYKKLREERLVPDDLDAVLSTFPLKNSKYRRVEILYTLNDTFILDFSSRGSSFPVITERGMGILPFSGPFLEVRPVPRPPYTGSALARFERSTLPSHKGKRILVLRFLQIITPVTCVIPSYDGFIVAPTEGELHQKCKNTNLYKEVWSVDIDKGGVMVPGLRLLWDATSTL